MTLCTRIAIMAFVTAGLFGCIPSAPPESGNESDSVEGAEAGRQTPGPGSDVSDEELVREWTRLATHPDQASRGRSLQIARELARRGPEALEGLLDVMAQPDVSPMTRQFAVQELVELVSAEHVPRLTEIVHENEDQTARACATMLLAQIPAEEAQDTLRDVLDDEEQRVRFAALLGLVQHGDEAMRERLMAMYSDPDTRDAEREQIIFQIVRNPTEEDIEILADAVKNPKTPQHLRNRVATTLGRVGDTSIVSDLKQSKEVAGNERYSSVVDAAIEAIQAREGTAESADDKA